MEKTDKKLIQDFLRGDPVKSEADHGASEDPFAVLVDRYLKMTYNFLYQITKDKNIIDDLTQETFLKAWKNLKKFETDKNFKTWLFTIAKNTAFDYFKKKKTTPFAEYELTERATGLEMFFAFPFHSWERGSNENANGLLRQYFPKGMPFAKVKQKEIEVVISEINHRPRKRHGYLTPLEVFYGKN